MAGRSRQLSGIDRWQAGRCHGGEKDSFGEPGASSSAANAERFRDGHEVVAGLATFGRPGSVAPGSTSIQERLRTLVTLLKFWKLTGYTM
jgi:hypothetical protein